MERAAQKSRTMVPSELCRVDAHKRRGHSGKAGCKSVGEKLHGQLQHRWYEFRVLQGRSHYQGKYLVSIIPIDALPTVLIGLLTLHLKI